MLANVFSFWIGVISSWVSWLFTLKINENPDITIGMFLLGCATIGIAIYFVFGSGILSKGSNAVANGVGNTTRGIAKNISRKGGK